METLINNFVSEHFAASLIVITIACVLFAILIWKLSQIWYDFKHLPCDAHATNIEELKSKSAVKEDLPCKTHADKIEDLKSKSIAKEELPCKSHAEKLEEHSLAVRKLETSMEFLNRNMERLSSQLSSKEASFTQQHSPLTISEKGWQVVKKLSMDKMFANNWDRIRQFIDEEVSSKNAYDINEFCIKYAVVYPEKFLQEEEVNVLKNDAYIQGLPLMDYMKIIAVMARDKYFEENNIHVGENK